MKAIGLEESADLEIHNARLSSDNAKYTEFLYARLQRQGYLFRDCQRLVNQDRNVFAACMEEKPADTSNAKYAFPVGIAVDPGNHQHDAVTRDAVTPFNLFLVTQQVGIAGDSLQWATWQRIARFSIDRAQAAVL